MPLLIPLGTALAGPLAAIAGIHATLIGSGVVGLACIAVILAQPSVWAIGAATGEAAAPA